MIELSKDQKNALQALLAWVQSQSRTPYITLGGYAGTGKTTLISFLRRELSKSNPTMRVGFCSFTGKAAQVLKRKLREHEAIYPKDTVGTIHSLIYKAIEDKDGAIIGWERRVPQELKYDLFIVDEASMVDELIWRDLLSYGVPIIAVGDHGQLPPINGTFNLMEKPFLTLEEIHRQARLNPIIEVSIMAREQGEIKPGHYGTGVEKISSEEAGTMIEEIFNSYDDDTLILCGYNSTRVKINSAIRANIGFETPEPASGDRVICLRNNRKKAIFNGMLGYIKTIVPFDSSRYLASIKMDGVVDTEVFDGVISAEQFNAPKTLSNINLGGRRVRDADLFDFGYAVTVHKAQGSQARKVVLIEERFKAQTEDLWRRWLYTAVTRAEEELLIIG
jgi:exodeoxyribonuclease-5